MALRINPKYNLKRRYNRYLETGLIISLSLLIAAFRFFPKIETKKLIETQPPDIVKVVDIERTRQDLKVPAPPKPIIVFETINIIEDPVIPDVEMGNEGIQLPPDRPVNHIIIEDDPGFIPVAEEMPEPIGGITAIQNRISYPEIPKRAGIEGKVYVLAFVDANGDVAETRIIKGVDGLNEAAEKAVKETKFKPGKQRGKAVKVQITIPVIFKLR